MEQEKSLADQAQNQLFFQTLLMSMPDLPKFYPQIEGIVNTIDKYSEDYLGDDEKMIVIVRKNGVTRAVVLNPKIDFTISNKMSIEGKGSISPLIANYEKEEYKQKLFELSIIKELKERYEKMDLSELSQTSLPNLQGLIIP